MKAKSAKAKGSKLEKWTMQALLEAGAVRARKQPGSGIYSDFPHDVWAELPGFGSCVVECKSWRHGWRTGAKALGAADLLVIKADYADPQVFMPWSTFKGIVEALRDAHAESDLDVPE